MFTTEGFLILATIFTSFKSVSVQKYVHDQNSEHFMLSCFFKFADTVHKQPSLLIKRSTPFRLINSSRQLKEHSQTGHTTKVCYNNTMCIECTGPH